MLRYGSLQLYKKCISKNVVKNAVILNLHIITNILRIPWKEFSDQFIFNSYTCFQKNSQTFVIMIDGSTILNLMEFFFVIYSSIIIFIRRKSQNTKIRKNQWTYLHYRCSEKLNKNDSYRFYLISYHSFIYYLSTVVLVTAAGGSKISSINWEFPLFTLILQFNSVMPPGTWFLYSFVLQQP